MAGSELTGIERQLVLEYLMDGNVPVTVTPIEKKASSDESVPASSAGVFPVALRAEQMTVLDQGIILLKNAPGSIKQFAGKDVRVQFYFNKLGLYFISQMKQVSSGLALVIPAKINHVDDKPEDDDHSFSVILYYEAGKKANSYLEKIVAASREGKQNIGNGVHLIPVVRYLAHAEKKVSSIQDRANPPSVLYIDHERVVFGAEKKNMILEAGCEYALKIGFPIEAGPVKERSVYVTAAVEQFYDSDDEERTCAVCRYTSIKEEDVRFLYEKVKKELFEI